MGHSRLKINPFAENRELKNKKLACAVKPSGSDKQRRRFCRFAQLKYVHEVDFYKKSARRLHDIL